VVRWAAPPTGVGISPDVDFTSISQYWPGINGRVHVRPLVQVTSNEPVSGGCTVEGRFYVDGDPDARILIYKPNYLSDSSILPRDIRAEFPYTLGDPRATWYDVVEAGEIWSRNNDYDSDRYGGSDEFTVTVSDRLIGLHWDTNMCLALEGSEGLVEIPDITVPKVDVEWEAPPTVGPSEYWDWDFVGEADDWGVEWTVYRWVP